MASNRTKTILSAIKTSFLSKGATLLLQFISMPLVARVLGPDQFGLYTMIIAIPAIFAYADLGVGPVLARKISEGVAGGSEIMQARYFQAAAQIVVFTSALLFAALGVSKLFLGSTALVTNRSLQEIITHYSFLISVVISIQIIISVGMKARSGYQEVHLNNLYGAFGNIAAAVALIAVAVLKPNLKLFVAASFLVGVTIQFLNTASLLRARSFLVRPWFKGLGKERRELIFDGLKFAAAIGLLYIQREFVKIRVGAVAGPAEAGRYGILLNVLTFAGGMTLMFTSALWPTIADAKAHKDWAYLKKLWVKMNAISAAYGACAFLGIAAVGQFGLNKIYGHAYHFDLLTVALLGLYFWVLTLGHIRFTWLLGSGKLGVLTSISALEFTTNMSVLFLLQEMVCTDVVLIVFTASHLFWSTVVQDRFVRTELATV